MLDAMKEKNNKVIFQVRQRYKYDVLFLRDSDNKCVMCVYM